MNKDLIRNGEYRIERLDLNRLCDLVALHKAIYGKDLATNFLTKKYDTAYIGHIYIGFLAFDNHHTPVAYYGVIPCFIKSENQLILCAQSADTMTHPEHRNKGLFIRLANLTFDLCRQEEIRLVFGFPNQNSQQGLVKLGWQTIGYLDRFTIPVTTFPLAKITSKIGMLRPLYKQYVNRTLKRHLPDQSAIMNIKFSESNSVILRDENYLNHKSYSQTFTIKIDGSTVWYKIQNGLVIGDMVNAEDNFETVLMQLKKISRQLGLQYIQFQVNKRSPLYNLLKKHAVSLPSFPIMIKDLGSGIDFGKLHFSFADIDIF